MSLIPAIKLDKLFPKKKISKVNQKSINSITNIRLIRKMSSH